MEKKEHLNRAYWSLKLVYGLVPIVAGLDKFTNLLTDWKQYLSPLATKIIPIAPQQLMGVVGVIEIVAGIIVLTKLTRVGAYIVSAWLLCIAINLVTTGHYFDIAVRDVVMACGAFVLGELCALIEPAHTRATTASDARLRHA